MKITSFDRTSARMIGQEAADALKAVAEKHGLTVDYAGGTLDTLSFTAKIAFKVDNPAQAEAAAKVLWKRYASHYGLNEEAFGWTFLYKGLPYKITGLAPSRPKFCVTARSVFGDREMFFPAITARSAKP